MFKDLKGSRCGIFKTRHSVNSQPPRQQFVTAALLNIQVFWGVALFRLVNCHSILKDRSASVYIVSSALTCLFPKTNKQSVSALSVPTDGVSWNRSRHSPYSPWPSLTFSVSASWFSRNLSDLYWGGVAVDPQPKYRLSWHRSIVYRNIEISSIVTSKYRLSWHRSIVYRDMDFVSLFR